MENCNGAESAVDFTGSTVRFLLVALLLHFSVCWCCMTTRFPTCDSQARTANLCELVTGRPRTTEGAHLRQAVSRRLLALSTSGRARCTALPHWPSEGDMPTWRSPLRRILVCLHPSPSPRRPVPSGPPASLASRTISICLPHTLSRQQPLAERLPRLPRAPFPLVVSSLRPR
ncbi:RHTO0S04e08592g1_1 [Rhodotorula toruloides]|uniref:RHTO0S04e08592g1_1 n=1 Tax=Rhodotorula toruloides TaxID=5286 RepID=A0A061AQ37_RHOTO|nr:RHTO0S04e08592g1_1 [Rhodotorula toruloides]